jgi:hypothetical protein
MTCVYDPTDPSKNLRYMRPFAAKSIMKVTAKSIMKGS